MPYIVAATKRTADKFYNDPYPDDLDGPDVTHRAVAMLEMDRCLKCGKRDDGERDWGILHAESCDGLTPGQARLPESGGTITLPDGTIEVSEVEWHDLYTLAGAPIPLAEMRWPPSPKQRAAIINAYNARQEA